MSKNSINQAKFDLLLQYGYRPDQLIPTAGGNDFRCSLDDFPAVIALVQNPHNLDITDPMREQIRQYVTLGYKPHHLLISTTGNVLYDLGRVEADIDLLPFARRYGPK